MRCTIYKTKKQSELYLYLAATHNFDELPKPLAERFTNPIEVMTIDIKADTHLARVDTRQVLKAFELQGFYLQLPPADPTIHDSI